MPVQTLGLYREELHRAFSAFCVIMRLKAVHLVLGIIPVSRVEICLAQTREAKDISSLRLMSNAFDVQALEPRRNVRTPHPIRRHSVA